MVWAEPSLNGLVLLLGLICLGREWVEVYSSLVWVESKTGASYSP